MSRIESHMQDKKHVHGQRDRLDFPLEEVEYLKEHPGRAVPHQREDLVLVFHSLGPNGQLSTTRHDCIGKAIPSSRGSHPPPVTAPLPPTHLVTEA